MKWKKRCSIESKKLVLLASLVLVILALSTAEVEPKSRLQLPKGIAEKKSRFLGDFGFGRPFGLTGGLHGLGGHGWGLRPYWPSNPYQGGFFASGGIPGLGLGFHIHSNHNHLFKHHHHHGWHQGWGWGAPQFPFH